MKQMIFTFTEEEKSGLLSWAEMLETTSFEQGFGTLRTLYNRFCCLGIYAFHVSPETAWIPFPDLRAFGLPCQKNVFAKSILPEVLSRRLGLNQMITFCTAGSITMLPLEKIFTWMNDSLEFSFPRIAQEIRSLISMGTFTEDMYEKLGRTFGEIVVDTETSPVL